VSVLRSPAVSLQHLNIALEAAIKDKRELSPAMADLLRSTLWVALTSEREGQHAVSNVLGAFRMGAQFGRSTAGDWGDAYVLKLLKVCTDQKGTDGKRTGEKPWLHLSKRAKRCVRAAVLIDDMADVWWRFVTDALGFESRTKAVGAPQPKGIFLASKPDQFLQMLAGLPERLRLFSTSGARFLSAEALLGAQRGVGPDFVLFLDLRLFPGGMAQGGQDYLREIVSVAIEVLDTDRHLAWLSTGDKAKLRKELEVASFGAASDKKMPPQETILPRLLSLLDPTLPIIIFSSTHRSEWTEPFRAYGNIITSFRKPVLAEIGQAWPDTVTGLRTDFVAALDKAAGILDARAAVRSVQQTALVEQAGGQEPEDPGVVELFFDESCRTIKVEEQQPVEQLTVGCVVALAPTADAIKAFCSDMEHVKNPRPVEWGLSSSNLSRYCQEFRVPWREHLGRKLLCHRRWSLLCDAAPAHTLPKRPQNQDSQSPNVIETAIMNLLWIAQANNVRLFAVALSANQGQARDLVASEVTGIDVVSADSLHHELVVRLTQMVLCHPKVAPAIANGGASLAFDLGDRTIPLAGRKECETVFQATGLRYLDQSLVSLTPAERDQLINSLPRDEGDTYHEWTPEKKTVVIDSDHALFGLKEALSGLGITGAKVHRSRAVALMDFGDIDSWTWRLGRFPAFPLQIHYLADWVSYVAGRKNAGMALQEWKPLESFFADGFVQKYSPATRQLLEIVLCGRHGKHGKAVADTAKWLRENPEPGPAEKMLLDTVASWAGSLEGADLGMMFTQQIAK
ncbi:MAG: hypothetical protein WCL44_13330, partial [bacterium]